MNNYSLSYLFPDKSMGDTSDIISDSSGVGTSNSDTTVSISLPGTVVVCTENYTATQPGHLSVAQGDLIEGKIVCPNRQVDWWLHKMRKYLRFKLPPEDDFL